MSPRKVEGEFRLCFFRAGSDSNILLEVALPLGPERSFKSPPEPPSAGRLEPRADDELPG